MGRYAEEFHRSIADPESFWGDAARAIDWYREPSVILDSSNPPFYRWFSDGELNTCFNALDRHVRDGRGDQDALIYDSPVTCDRAPGHLPGTARPGGQGGPVCCATSGWPRVTGWSSTCQ